MNQPFRATAEVTIQATTGQVWDALTDPALVKQYFFGVEVVTDWKEGSSIIYKGEWEGKAFEDKGTVLKVEPEKMLVTRYWTPSFGDDVPENYQQVTYELFAEGEATRLVVTQEHIPTQESADHSTKNWQTVLEGMKKLLEA